MDDILKKSEIDVLMVIEGEIATTQLLEQILTACAVHGVRFRKRLLKDLQKSDISANTIPLFVRCGDPCVVHWVEMLKQADHPYVYYIDDNFWQINGSTPLSRYYQHPIVRHSLQVAISNANKVLTNSIELASVVSRINERVTVLPAFFDFCFIEGVALDQTDEIRIGFAGSTSRVDDLEIIRPIVGPILQKHPNAVFEFAGVLPKGITPNDRIRYFPYMQSYSAFIRFQAERNWAIGLAPLIDHEANRCKTDNKYREYGACGIAGVYSSIPPYEHSVRDGVTGVLTDNSYISWLTKVTELVVNVPKREALGRNASRYVKEEYCVKSVARKWALLFVEVNDALRRSPPGSLIIPSELTQIRNRILELKLLIDVARYEGGMPLVLRRSARRLIRLFGGRV